MNRKNLKWVLPLFGVVAGLSINNFFLLGSVTAQERGASCWYGLIFSMIQFLGVCLLCSSLLSLGRMQERAKKKWKQWP